jgi:hypothetical protein
VSTPGTFIRLVLKIVGFDVLLHKVPKEQAARQVFCNFSAHCKFSGYRLGEFVTFRWIIRRKKYCMIAIMKLQTETVA